MVIAVEDKDTINTIVTIHDMKGVTIEKTTHLRGLSLG